MESPNTVLEGEGMEVSPSLENENRVNVYLCSCGTIISDKVDLDAVTKELSNIEYVSAIKTHKLLCSVEGLKYLKKDIRNTKPTHVVIAACTPKTIEAKFMNACKEAGLNPYLSQIVNIREQCVWVTSNSKEATEKAKALIRAMVYRVVQQEPLEEKEIECNSDVLVVGAGVSGSIATLTLAEQKDRRVYLLEKAPCIGGLVARFEEVSPTLECAPCMMASILEEVLDKDNITILTNSEITDVKGSVGNFHVKIDKKARYVSLENCIGCGECYEPCPVSVKNEFDEGLSDRKAIYVPFAGSLPNVPIIDTENCLNFKDEGQAQSCELCKDSCGFDAIDFNDKGEELDIKVGGVIISTGARYFEPEQKQRFENVYTNMEFERIISQTGPTQGEIRLATGKAPSSVAIIHCVGRDKLGYCSRVCCSASLRYSHTIKNKLPEANVYEIYTDFVVPGKREQGFYKEVEQKGVEFIRREENSIPEISTRGDLLNVSFEDAKGEHRELDVDLVILSCGIIPSEDNRAIAELFDIECDDKGFFKEDHMKIRDYMTATEGIFIAGTAQWPKSIEESIAQSIASCGKILAKLVPGEKMPIETKTAEIDEELCSGCKICISLCPYKAISFDEEKDVCVVDEALCKGCGTCSASCPSKISKNKHFTTEQIFAEIKGVIA